MRIAEVVGTPATRRSVRAKAANVNLKFAHPAPVPLPLYVEHRLVFASQILPESLAVITKTTFNA